MSTDITRFSGDYRFLSNFWHEPKRGGYTVEHFYQAAKAENPEDSVLILSQQTAGQAKRLGQKVKMREDWEDVKNTVMLKNVRAKFTLDPKLRRLLLDTGDAFLCEGNTWGDTYWGVDEVKGGQNHLGQILMKVRDELAFYGSYLVE